MKAHIRRIQQSWRTVARITFAAAVTVLLAGCGLISKDFEGEVEFNFTVSTNTDSYGSVTGYDPNSNDSARLAAGQVASTVRVGLQQSVGIGGQLSFAPPSGSHYELMLQYTAATGQCVAKGTALMKVQANGMTPVAFVALRDVLKPCPNSPAFAPDALSLPPGELVVWVRPIGFRLTPKDRIYLKVQGFKVTVQKSTA